MPKAIGPVEVEECERCKGVWFDKDELRQAKDITDSDLNWMDFEIWKHEDKFKAKASETITTVASVTTTTIKQQQQQLEMEELQMAETDDYLN